MGGPGGPAGGLRLGPPGRWWDDPEFIKKLGLSDNQQKKMDEIFNSARLKLIDLFAAVQKEEAIMEPLVAADPPDENKLLAQIDRVAQARAELEKANARMLLGIRSQLTHEQWLKLKAERPPMHGADARSRRGTRRGTSARQGATLKVGFGDGGRASRPAGRAGRPSSSYSQNEDSRPAKDRDACMTDRNRPRGRPSIDSTNRNSKKIGFPALQPLQASLTLFIFGRSIPQTSSPRCGQAAAGGRGHNFTDKSRKLLSGFRD